MLLRAIATVGSMTLISRILGFVRDVAVAWALGASWMADVFFVAFKLPNLFRRLFAEGAFNLAFVPIFAGKLETEDNQDGASGARTFAAQAQSGLLVVLLMFTIVIELAMPWVVMAIAPGFLDEPQKYDLAVDLMRITFPYLIFISWVSLLGGIMNSLHKFWQAAATPVLLNITLITSVFALTPLMPSPAHALSWGVALGGVVQLLWMVYHVTKAGWRPKLVRPNMTDDVKRLLKRIAPVAVGAGIYQVSLLIDTIIASLLVSGSISYLFYADRLVQLPVGVVGVAVGTALLPMLSRQIKSGDDTQAQDSQNRAVEFALLLTLPAAAALFILPETLISVLFERGEFGAEATHKTAMALMVFALGLPAYVLVKAFAPGYFAREDMSTPIKIGAVCVAVNIAIALALMGPLAHVGLAAATVISQWLNAGLLAFFLIKRGHFHMDGQLRRRLWRTLLATLMMAGVVWGLDQVVAQYLGKVLGLIAIVVGGMLSYGAAAQVLGAARLGDLKGWMRRS
ncbi:murein biosynthesis integral membrane protein MurJ [Magnetovibrio sp. PR-2]|uniref:murein biosynthesis integral membrane protein MurJ n=1 Tax=Magnetovibrio sp. PR-2 TaxID=3120356 RepID=UPI002FCE2A54